MSFFIGKALRVNTGAATGAETNQMIGHCAGDALDGGLHNNFFGLNAGCCHTTGFSNNFFGQNAGRCHTTAFRNNFIGAYAGRTTTTGRYNIFIGGVAGLDNTSGDCNNFFGIRAGVFNTTGANNLAFGRYSATSIFNPSGFFNLTTASNRIFMGNSNHTCAQIQIGWTTVSDIRDKCVFGNVKHGKGFLKKLNPIEFAFKDRVSNDIADPLGKTRYGFSAQEVLEAEGEHPVIVSTEDPTKLQMTNDYLIPVLVNAIKEMSDDIDELKTEIAILKNQHA
jgi:hypothetical protein